MAFIKQDITVFTGDAGRLILPDNFEYKDYCMIENNPAYSKLSFFVEDTANKKIISSIKSIFTNRVISFNGLSPDIVVYNMLKEKGLTIATAESLTGGGLGEFLTQYPGSSVYFKGSIVAYSNDIKMSLLDVSENTLDKFGAVSKECAYEMALAVAKKMKTDMGISLTGIAGPSGSEYKQNGETYIGVFFKGDISVYRYIFTGNRAHNRACAINASLYHICEVLDG